MAAGLYERERLISLATRAPAGNRPISGRYGFEAAPTEPFVAALLFCLCVQALGMIVVVVELLLLGILLVIRWRSLPAIVVRRVILFALPIFAVVSAFWSPVSGASLRYGIQLGLTVLIGVVIAASVQPRRLPFLVFIGVGASLLIGMATGRTGLSVDGAVLIGLTGSKNQIGFFALFWLIASCCVAASPLHRLPVKILAIGGALIAAYLVWQSNSMTALISTVVVLGTLFVLAVIARFTTRGRQFALIGVALAVSPLILAQDEISRQVEYFVIDTLDKDPRLTGRGLLWQEADVLIDQKPLLGWGYKGIWLGPEGAGLLARHGQSDGRSFHFHDTVRELRVDLGWVGLLLFLLPLVYVTIRAAGGLVSRIDVPRAFAIATMMAILMRFRVDLVISPFLADTVFLFMSMAMLGWSASAVLRPSTPATSRRPVAPSQPLPTFQRRIAG